MTVLVGKAFAVACEHFLTGLYYRCKSVNSAKYCGGSSGNSRELWKSILVIFPQEFFISAACRSYVQCHAGSEGDVPYGLFLGAKTWIWTLTLLRQNICPEYVRPNLVQEVCQLSQMGACHLKTAHLTSSCCRCSWHCVAHTSDPYIHPVIT